MARLVYCDRTDMVEPFGLDETWIDVAGSLPLFSGDEARVAKEISERVKSEFGLTVSIGVNWNKVFAKLGSDTDPRDGAVSITPENYREVAWGLPVRDLIYVGAATERKLLSSGYLGIGDLAYAGDYHLTSRWRWSLLQRGSVGNTATCLYYDDSRWVRGRGGLRGGFVEDGAAVNPL